MENKLDILTRLVKDGHISLEEAFLLNETEKEIVAQPYPVYPQPYSPYPTHPTNPYPVSPFWWNNSITVSNGTATTCNPDKFVMSGTYTLTDNRYYA